MKKLTDVYIKVTNSNVKELMKQINRYDLQPHTYVFFVYDSIKGNEVSLIEPKNKQKVSLSQLKRLIDTIPTREEIIRLKRQISAYKTNYDKVVKHSLSKEDVIEDLQRKLNRERSTTTDLFKQRKEVQLNHCEQIHKLSEEIERLKNINLTLKQTNNNLYDNEDIFLKDINHLERKLDIQADLIRDKNAQLEQLKQRKWYQFW